MGIDSNRFVNLGSFEDDLLCAICCSVLEDPLSLTRCGHTYCRQCILRWLKERKTCPIDGSEICRLNALIPTPLIVKNIIGRQKVHCEYEANGCEEIISLDLLKDHSDKCKHRPTLKHRIRRNVDRFICSLFSRRQQQDNSNEYSNNVVTSNVVQNTVINDESEAIENSIGSIYYDSFYQRQRRTREAELNPLNGETSGNGNQQRVDFTVELKLLLIFFLVLSCGCIFKGMVANLTHFYYENEIVCWLTLIAGFAVWRNQQHLISNYI